MSDRERHLEGIKRILEIAYPCRHHAAQNCHCEEILEKTMYQIDKQLSATYVITVPKPPARIEGKVYCTECKWYIEGLCKNPNNLYEGDSWASRIKQKAMPWDINDKNDCKWHELREGK